MNSDTKWIEGNTYISEPLYILGPGCAEHESLSIGTNLPNNLANLGFEPHIEHAISLVHDEICDTTKSRLLRF